MSFLQKLKTFDVYRDVPKDLTEQTVTGAAVSIVATCFIVYLFTTEFFAFMTVRTVSELYVDAPTDTADVHAMIQINMNITMHKLPCAIVSVDAQDIMGSHVVDVGGELKKIRIRDGVEMRDSMGEPIDHEKGKAEEQKGEGCNVAGNMIVKKVPGNFHVSCHAHANLYHIFFSDQTMNISHTIHHLSFGDKVRVNAARGTNPLNDVVKHVQPTEKNGYGHEPQSFEYYIKIVPTNFEFLNGQQEDSYQFVANSNEIFGHYQIPAIYFRYDLSPITMKFKETKTTFSHFLVQVCAIIGGVFVVLGMINSMLHSSLRHVMKKAEMNKLG